MTILPLCFVGIVGKAPGQAVRVAAVLSVALQCIKDVCLDVLETKLTKEVEAASVTAAVQIVEFYMSCNVRMCGGPTTAGSSKAGPLTKMPLASVVAGTELDLLL